MKNIGSSLVRSLFALVFAGNVFAVRAALPEGYRQLSCLSMDGRQYLDTGYTPDKASIGYSLDFAYNGEIGTAGKRIFGSTTRSPNDGYGFFLGGYQSSASGKGGQGFYRGASVFNPQIMVDTRMQISLINGIYSTSEGDEIDLSSYTSTEGFGGSVFLGWANIPNQLTRTDLMSPCMVYNLKFYDGETVIHNFVPAIDDNGAIGFYDDVETGSLGFKTSATSFAFEALGGNVKLLMPKVSGAVSAELYVGGVLASYGGDFLNVDTSGHYVAVSDANIVVKVSIPEGTALVWDESSLPTGATVSGNEVSFVMPAQSVVLKADVTAPSTLDVEGYRRLEYLEATGEQYIDTGVFQGPSVAMDLTMALTPATYIQSECEASGAAAMARAGWIFAGRYGGKDTLSAYFCAGTDSNDPNVPVGASIPRDTAYHRYFAANGYQAVDTTCSLVTTDVMPRGDQQAVELRLFAALLAWTDSRYCPKPNADINVRKQKISHCVIYENGAIVRNFVPALRIADSKPGLYDTANGVFYTNANASASADFGYPAGKLVVTGVPEEFGSPTPGYGEDLEAVDGQSRTYRAQTDYPILNATGDRRATACAGWSLLMLDGTKTEGSGATYTIDTYSSDYVGAVLTWRYDYESRVAADFDAGRGSVSGTGFYAPGATVTLTASPAAGTVFKGWEGEVVATEAAKATTLTFTMPNHPVTVKAAFRLPTEPDPEDYATAGLKMSVLGDSYSSFKGAAQCIGPDPYYPDSSATVKDLDQMWWRRVSSALGTEVGGCDAYAGTAIGYIRGKENCFLASKRIWGEYIQQSDILFIFGGANDQGVPPAEEANQGDYLYDPEDWTNDTLKDFRPALAALLHRAQAIMPKARIYFIANAPATDSETDVYLKPAFIESIETVCAHYGVGCIKLHDIERVNRHPTANGMMAIATQVVAFVQQDFKDRAAYAYSDRYVVSNDAGLQCTKLGNERVYISTNSSKRLTLVTKQPMTLRRVLAVGGGGAGGQTYGGGGGGGGVTEKTYEDRVIPADTKFVLTVGAGGDWAMATSREKSSATVSPDNNYWQYGISGTLSMLMQDSTRLVTAGGGGGGGGWSIESGNVRNNGRDGTEWNAGSGGGAHGGTGTSGSVASSGFAGGDSDGTAAGGGGGAGGAGAGGAGTASGAGGAGVTSDITGESIVYGAGGGGGAGTSVATPGAAGGANAGAGGAAGAYGESAMDGFGGGGGGGSYDSDGFGYVGGKGGNGRIVLRFEVQEKNGILVIVR